MKTRVSIRRMRLTGIVALLLAATPGFALFGIGDIVFDPTSYGSLVQQLTTLQMQYSTVKNNLTHFSLKQQWQTALMRLEDLNVANLFGETAGISIALNANSPSASLTGWKAATVPISGATTEYLGAQGTGSAQRAELAMIETSDAISPDCLTAVGQYRSGRAQNTTANSNLVAQQFDTTASTNTEVEQLNLLNAAEAQKLSEIESQGTLQACLASQMTIVNMERRNAAALDLNTAALVTEQRAADDTSAANEGSTWANYLP